MFTQFFGSYLLEKELVSPEQLTDAISKMKDSRVRLGTLALHKGLMTPAEVDECCFLQKREDNRFGEIAIERNYLTDEQVTDLLKTQEPDYLLLGQILVEDGVFTNAEFEKLIFEYQSANEIYDIDINTESKDKIRQLVEKFFFISETPVSEHAIMYLNLMFNNLVRFIGEDFTPIVPVPCTEFPVNYCVHQNVKGGINFVARIDMEKDTAIALASRYAKEDFTEFDEYVAASIEDFLNLHNGLFVVNMSNEFSIELTLDPPEVDDGDIISLTKESYVIPIVYPFGTLHLIVTL